TTTFTGSAKLGGNGGNGGDGGEAGIAGNIGLAGKAGKNVIGASDGTDGAAGKVGNVGIGGVGGDGGNGTMTLKGGAVNVIGTLELGGNCGEGGLTGGGSTTRAACGKVGTGTLLISSGTLNLGNDSTITLHGTSGSATLGSSGKLNFSGDAKIVASDGNFTFQNGGILARSTESGVLSLIANEVSVTNSGATPGKIKLLATGDGNFLSINAGTNGVYDTSFDLSAYRDKSSVTKTNSAGVDQYSLTLAGAESLEWKTTGTGNGTWKLGKNQGGGNWDKGDFYAGDTANFNQNQTGVVKLAGNIAPAEMNINAGNYTFTDNGTESGGLLSQGKLSVAQNASATFANSGLIQFGNGANVSGNVTLNNGSQFTDMPVVVESTGTLFVTATSSADDAAIQGGSLILEKDSTLYTKIDSYIMNVGDTKSVYIGNGLTNYENNGAKIQNSGSRIYKISDLYYQNSDLYYELTRLQTKFPNVTPGINGVYDAYTGGNSFIDYTINIMDADAASRLVQSGFDLTNLSGSQSSFSNINNKMIDTLRFMPTNNSYSRRNVAHTQVRGQSGPASAKNYWGGFTYSNNRGSNLNSGNYQYKTSSNEYTALFGVDRSSQWDRIGLSGIVGYGKSTSSGSLLPTTSETNYGGLFAYINSQMSSFDLFATLGWLGSESKMSQWNGSAQMSSKIQNNMINFAINAEKSMRFAQGRFIPTIGVQYSALFQGDSNIRWGGETILHQDKTTANLCIVPVGFRLTSDSCGVGWISSHEFHARYLANFGDRSTNYNVYAVGSSVPVMMSSVLADRHIGDVGISFKRRSKQIEMSLDYSYLFSEQYQTHAGTAAIRFLY
ncbi:MAG: hypothetical protein ACRCUY_09465, partial [Thermoguttaceae bacterium]